MSHETTSENECPSTSLGKIVVCDAEAILRVTMEWDMKLDNGYEKAEALLKEKYNFQYLRTVRGGPKMLDFPKINSDTFQWIVDVYI